MPCDFKFMKRSRIVTSGKLNSKNYPSILKNSTATDKDDDDTFCNTKLTNSDMDHCKYCSSALPPRYSLPNCSNINNTTSEAPCHHSDDDDDNDEECIIAIPLPLPHPTSNTNKIVHDNFNESDHVLLPLPLPIRTTIQDHQTTSTSISSLSPLSPISKLEQHGKHSRSLTSKKRSIKSSMKTTQTIPTSSPTPFPPSLVSSNLDKEFLSSLQPLPLPNRDEIVIPGLKHFKYEELVYELDHDINRDGNCLMGTIKGNGKSSKPQDVAIVCIQEPWQRQRFHDWAIEITTFVENNKDFVCQLIGFSVANDKSKYMLVYERLKRGSLYNLLFGVLDDNIPSLHWTNRMKIVYEAAKGLLCLHEKWPQRVLFEAFSTHYIEIGIDYTAKIFGYSFVNTLNSKTHSNIEVNIGYQAPETIDQGRISLKSNVWSFGVVLLELLTGKSSMDKNIDLVRWAKPFLMDARKLFLVMDPRLRGKFPEEGAKLLAHLILQCIEINPRYRPNMKEVVSELQHIQTIKCKSSFMGEENMMSNVFQSPSPNKTSPIQSPCNGTSPSHESLLFKQPDPYTCGNILCDRTLTYLPQCFCFSPLSKTLDGSIS